MGFVLFALALSAKENLSSKLRFYSISISTLVIVLGNAAFDILINENFFSFKVFDLSFL